MRLSIPPRPAGLGARIFQWNNIRSTRRFIAVEVEFKKGKGLLKATLNYSCRRPTSADDLIISPVMV